MTDYLLHIALSFSTYFVYVPKCIGSKASGTWELVLLPAVKIIVGCQWAYIANNRPNGYIEPDRKVFLH